MKYKIKEFMKADISKFYILGVSIICLLLLGGFFSYAIFTVSKEKNNAISIVTGNLTYKLSVDGSEGNILTVPKNTTKEFIVTLSNPNNRMARFNFYYIGDLQEGVTVGYVPVKGVSTPPDEKGINLETSGSSGSSSIYRIQVKNSSDSEITIALGAGVGLDYNDLSLPSNGHLFNEIELDEGAKKVLADNEIETSLDDMFNYASNGMYLSGASDDGQPQYETDESQVTNGLYSMEDEDGTSYYFRGAVDNNNVQFGEYTEDYYVYNYGSRFFQSLASCQEYNSSCSESNRVLLASQGDKMYWKIVRVNGDGSLRLIYNGVSTNPTNADLVSSSAIGLTPYNLEGNDPKYTGYTYDNGTDSFIKKEVDTWYSNTLGSSSYDSKVSSGRFCSDSSGYREETMLGVSVFASFDRLSSAYGKLMGLEMQENVTPTLKCPTTSESYGGSYRLKAGLITADELVLAGESMGVVGNSYLTYKGNFNIDYGFYTMSPLWLLDETGFLYSQSRGLSSSSIIDDYVSLLRPVINVTTDNGFTSGDGTATSPYVLS